MQCNAYAIRGGTVCRMHGGAAPQVRAAAARRLFDERLERRAARFDAMTPERQDELVRALLPLDPALEHLDAGVGVGEGTHRGNGGEDGSMGTLPRANGFRPLHIRW